MKKITLAFLSLAPIAAGLMATANKFSARPPSLTNPPEDSGCRAGHDRQAVSGKQNIRSPDLEILYERSASFSTAACATLFCITDLDIIRVLWREYWASMGLPGDFQNFDAELASLPGVYQRLLITRVEGNPAGTVALRPLTKNACEVKRLYVRPAYRGQGLARKLIADVIAEARALGYTQMYCDTLPIMQSALVLYRSLGFIETEPYSDHPTPGAIFLTLAL